MSPATGLAAAAGGQAIYEGYKPGTEPGTNRHLGLQGPPDETPIRSTAEERPLTGVGPVDGTGGLARMQAIVRRSKGHQESTIRTGKLVVNLDARVVTVDDEPLHLTGKEYGVLELLSLRKDTTLTKWLVAGAGSDANERTNRPVFPSMTLRATPISIRAPSPPINNLRFRID